jgi:superfamily II DNA or RNA helicase
LSKLVDAPWPVILTTTDSSLGHDLVAVAYVIQTSVPDSYSAFVQNAGRGNRVSSDAPLTGALITTSAVYDMKSVK